MFFRVVRRSLFGFAILLICQAQSLASTIDVSDAWARPTFAMATTGAAYITLANTGEQADRLIDVSVSESVARKAEIHDHIMQDDMMKMRHLEDGIELPSGSVVAFAPGGKHIMLMGLTGPLEEGQQVDITLVFEHGEAQTVSVPVQDKTADQDSHQHHHHH